VTRDILLTGIPRSGTTLACRLLCDFSQTIALNEPMDRDQFDNPTVAFKNIKNHFQIFRKSLVEDGSARARTSEGRITDNAFTPDNIKRERIVKRSEIIFDKKLNPDFTLIMKHCAEFTLLIPELLKEFEIYALIRNPLAVLSSWASVDVPVSRGKVAKAAKLNPLFHEELEKQGENILDRQLFILSWYFGQYDFLPKDHIIRYEEMIQSPEDILSPIANNKYEAISSELKNKNTSNYYDRNRMKTLAKALLNSDGNYWKYYSADMVKELL
jgi:hypothetical protein